MAKSQQTFNKIEKEKARAKKREEKKKKKEARRADGGTDGIQFAYVDAYGNLSDTPMDPADKIKVDAEDIVLGVPKKEEGEEEDPVRQGKVSFYDDSKGFGFIIDLENNEK
ncbi:MAG: cold shock domain-containing protein, partial [Gelidibacter sp.]